MKKLILVAVLAVSTISWASGAVTHHEEGGIPWKEIGLQALNLGILLVGIFFFTKESIKQAFINRKKQFVEQSESTKSPLQNAELALSGVKTKISQLEAGENKALEKASQEAALVKTNLIKESEAQAIRLKEESKMQVSAELEKAKNEIGILIMGSAISATTRKLSDQKAQITKDSESEFLRQVGQVKA